MFVGMFACFGLIMLLGGSLEMIWSLINTLQIISYLPLMISNYPKHVSVMFEILGFTNMDIEILSNMFKSVIKIDLISLPSFNQRFLDYGIESPLFLDN